MWIPGILSDLSTPFVQWIKNFLIFLIELNRAYKKKSIWIPTILSCQLQHTAYQENNRHIRFEMCILLPSVRAAYLEINRAFCILFLILLFNKNRHANKLISIVITVLRYTTMQECPVSFRNPLGNRERWKGWKSNILKIFSIIYNPIIIAGHRKMKFHMEKKLKNIDSAQHLIQ